METPQGAVVIVTGASSGIGEATSRLLHNSGFRVVLAARRFERLQSLKVQLEAGLQLPNLPSAASKLLAVPADITDKNDRNRLISETMEAFGRIDALVNNAGYGQRGPIELVSIEDIRRNFETNLFSLIALTQLVIPIMRRQGRGRIVNVGSVAGRIARPFSSVYDATKHALEAVTDGLRGEMRPFGIHVSLIQPGFILTEFIDASDKVSKQVLEQPGPYAPYLGNFAALGKKARAIAGQPDDIGRLVLRALSDEPPRFRYVAPLHAKLFLAMKHLLPARLFEEVVLRQMGLKRRPKTD
jgi:NAD(P)-dependent dehydrogenase (short-subunit alcohol dehydrogenase family)